MNNFFVTIFFFFGFKILRKLKQKFLVVSRYIVATFGFYKLVIHSVLAFVSSCVAITYIVTIERRCRGGVLLDALVFVLVILNCGLYFQHGVLSFEI